MTRISLLIQRLSWTALAGLILAAGLRAQGGESDAAAALEPPQQSRAATLDPLTLPEAQTPRQMSPDLTPPAVPDNYLIGREDLLSIFVYQMPELTAQARVNSEGYIELPFLRRPMPASGETPLQLRSVLARELVSEGLARDPVVRVVVRQVESRPVVVAGAVRYPEVIQAARPMRLIEVLSRAGGLQNSAGTTVLVTTGSGAERVTREYSVRALLQSGSGGPLLIGGETVRVIPARLVYVVGALQKPGAFPIQPGESITVLKALALAEGFSDKKPPNKSHAEIIRSEPNGAREELPVNLNEILKHKKPDLPLQADDIFYVPEDGKATIVTQAVADASQALVVFIGYHGL